MGVSDCEGNEKVREWIGGVKPVLTMRFGNGAVSKLKSCKPSLFEVVVSRAFVGHQRGDWLPSEFKSFTARLFPLLLTPAPYGKEQLAKHNKKI